MRILAISNSPLLEHQGSGYAILNFSRGLRQLGHEVDLFGPDSFLPFQKFRKALTYRQSIGMVPLVLRQLRKTHYDIIEFYGAESWLAASLLRRLPNRQFLMTVHSNGLETHSYEVMMRHLGTTSSDGTPNRWYQLD